MKLAKISMRPVKSKKLRFMIFQIFYYLLRSRCGE
jgi:hypothetical protein